MPFHTVQSEPKRFIVQYSFGSARYRLWETADFSAELARARFFKQRFTQSTFAPVRVLNVFEVLEVIEC